MGVDIYLFVEVRQPDGTWKSVDEWTVDGAGVLRVDHDKRFYNDRNYNLFAILANVRNNSEEFARERFNPISEPKGLPADVSNEVRIYSKQLGMDGRSYSWHTVADLLAFDWSQTVYLGDGSKVMYGEASSDFWSNTIPRLLRLGRPEDVRIVFWFD